MSTVSCALMPARLISSAVNIIILFFISFYYLYGIVIEINMILCMVH